MLEKMKPQFKRGDKVRYLLNKHLAIYDFGYISQTGHAVIYKEGECNMQDSIAVDVKFLRKVKPSKKKE